MSKPRRVLPGSTYLITRRCLRRQFLLRPSRDVNQVFLFCLAHSAGKCGIEVHAFCVLSNHYHLVVTDPLAKLPEFMQWLDLYVSKCLNARYGRWGAFWEPEKYGGVQIIESADVLDKIVYTLANPVAAGLVRWGSEWPGLRSRIEDTGSAEWVATRPGFYFDPEGPVPEEARLRLVRPPIFAELSDEAFVSLLRERYSEREREIQSAFDEEGRKFLGRSAVRKQSRDDYARSHEKKRTLNPRIACKRKWPRIQVLEQLTEWAAQYAEALTFYLSGDHTACFPPGTYWMRVQFDVRCYAPT
jgi:REP element-mobilizing transposase RayT